MSHANSALQVTDLDFDNIRSSLKTFLSSQSKFSDYDFEGSNMSVLLDLLAYNTHYNSFYLNMTANEMFLKTAQLRNNAVERATELGYTPTSSKGAVLEVNVTIVPSGSPSSITIPKDTKFNTTVDDKTLTFTNEAAVVIVADANSAYIAKSTTISEGFPLSHRFTVSTSSPVDYIIPNQNVDTDRITVRVQDSGSSTVINTYNLATDITELNGDSKIYYLEETEKKQYRIRFGDDILGTSLVDGNIVIIDYHITNTTAGNGASVFTSAGSIDGHSSVTVSLTPGTSVASGGAEQESVESIKFNAPLHFETQNRAVTKGDYERIILAENTDFDAVSIWGGEDNSPFPVYGKVFISIKPSVGSVISKTRKDQLVRTLDNRNVLSIDPEIVDAEFLYVVPTVEVNYNPDKTTLSAGSIESAARSIITDFQTDNLDSFGKIFRFSKFTKVIDDVDTSILSNETTIKMRKEFTPTLNVSTKYTIEFRNAIKNSGNAGDLTSSKFTFSGVTTAQFRDNASGTIDIVQPSGAAYTVMEADIGTINYTTGLVTISSFKPTASALSSGDIQINVIPADFDIFPLREQILQLAGTVVSTTQDREL